MENLMGFFLSNENPQNTLPVLIEFTLNIHLKNYYFLLGSSIDVINEIIIRIIAFIGMFFLVR